jgi:hypothetical protein
MVQSCARCGRLFRDGQTRYLVIINVVADFDGTLGPPGAPGELTKLWKEVEEKSEEELQNEVFQKLSFTLCKPCRDSWVSSPLGESLDHDAPAAGQLH